MTGLIITEFVSQCCSDALMMSHLGGMSLRTAYSAGQFNSQQDQCPNSDAQERQGCQQHAPRSGDMPNLESASSSVPKGIFFGSKLEFDG